jgi:hypothetical protein
MAQSTSPLSFTEMFTVVIYRMPEWVITVSILCALQQNVPAYILGMMLAYAGWSMLEARDIRIDNIKLAKIKELTKVFETEQKNDPTHND